MCLVVLNSCQVESLTIEQEAEELSFLQDFILTGLIKSVSSHDGSFDDIIDNASCYSINFPYQIELNGKVKNITSIADINDIKEEDEVLPIFPITISRATYDEVSLNSIDDFVLNQQNCANGLLYNDRITCVDFTYPIEVGVFNENSNDFDFISLEHDKDTFTTIESFLDNTLASIRFPIYLIDDNNSTEIRSNEQLKEAIRTIALSCE